MGFRITCLQMQKGMGMTGAIKMRIGARRGYACPTTIAVFLAMWEAKVGGSWSKAGPM
jgi:hypothetical protein